jgi:hypothetical protein
VGGKRLARHEQCSTGCAPPAQLQALQQVRGWPRRDGPWWAAVNAEASELLGLGACVIYDPPGDMNCHFHAAAGAAVAAGRFAGDARDLRASSCAVLLTKSPNTY